MIRLTATIFNVLVLSLAANAQTVTLEYYMTVANTDETLIAAVAIGETHETDIHILSTETGGIVLELFGQPHPPLNVALSHDSQWLATSGGDGLVRVWCIDLSDAPSCDTGQLIHELDTQGLLLSVAWSDNGELATSGYDGPVDNIWVWDSRLGFKVVTSTRGPIATQIIWNNRLDLVIGASEFGGAFAMYPYDDARVNRILGPEINMYSIAQNADETLIAFGALDGTVGVVEIDTNEVLYTTKFSDAAVYALAFSPDGSQIAVARGDGKTTIWTPGTRDTRTLDTPKRYAANIAIDWTAANGLILGRGEALSLTGIGDTILPETLPEQE